MLSVMQRLSKRRSQWLKRLKTNQPINLHCLLVELPFLRIKKNLWDLSFIEVSEGCPSRLFLPDTKNFLKASSQMAVFAN